MDHPWMATLPSLLCLSIRGCQSYCAIHGPSMDGHLDHPPLSKYPWMPQLLCHPWNIHRWPPCPASSVKVSVDATVTVPSMDHPWMETLSSLSNYPSYCAIHGPSMDGHLAQPPFVKVSMDATVTVPSMDHPWMDTLSSLLCLTIRRCHSYCVHPWTIHRWTRCPASSVKLSVDARVTVPSMDHPWMATLPSLLCQIICRCHSYCAIHGLSMNGHLVQPPLSKYPWMPQLLCLSMDHP